MPCCLKPTLQISKFGIPAFGKMLEKLDEAIRCFCPAGPGLWDSSTPGPLTPTSLNLDYSDNCIHFRMTSFSINEASGH